MKEIINEITKYLWMIPKMDLLTVQEIIKLIDNEWLAADLLRTLKENEGVLKKTIPDEAIKITLQVVAANK